MNTAKLASKLINRARNLQEFTVVAKLPDDFKFNGVVPFDLTIHNRTASIKVYAVDVDEANNKVDQWMLTCQ